MKSRKNAAAKRTGAPPELTAEQYTRYSRHLILPEVGLRGQMALRKASVVVVGAGGLGSPCSLYLAAAGVGTIGLVDFDEVDLTNLQRQILHSTREIGKPKVQSARRRLKGLNPDTTIRQHKQRLTSANALEVLAPYDVVVDGTDNFPTRYLINDACVRLGKPCIYGAIYRFEGQCSVFFPGRGPCYRCLYPEPPPPDETPSCAEGGVLGALPGVIGAIQATEAIKLILGKGQPLIGRLLLYNALDMRFRELRIQRDPDCCVCGDRPSLTELIDYEEFCGFGEGEGPGLAIPQIDVQELKRKMDRGEEVFVLDVRQPGEVEFAPFPGALNIPLRDLPGRLSEINPQRERQVVVVCREGVRSRRACQCLRGQGFADVANVAGGILAWSRRIDPNVPVY